MNKLMFFKVIFSFIAKSIFRSQYGINIVFLLEIETYISYKVIIEMISAEQSFLCQKSNHNE